MQLPKVIEDALNAEDQERLRRIFAPVRIAAGECIFRAGAHGDHCYIIEHGDVRL